MKTFIYPPTAKWAPLMERPAFNVYDLNKTVLQIFDEIRKNGDKAVKRFTWLFDKVKLQSSAVTAEEIDDAERNLSEELIKALKFAKRNIEKFHAAQLESKKVIETTNGVTCWRESRAIDKIGIYIPGGTAPLFSTVLMLGIPAKLAGCKDIVLCSPPDKQGNIDPAILFAAKLVGVTAIYKIGGIQAIGAMTFGTPTIPKVNKIFGPGNQFVNAAKQMVQNYGVATDMPAGPSELLVIADDSSIPEFVAADLLSQAEHGIDSQVILLSDSKDVIAATLSEIGKQLKEKPRAEIALKALENSRAILLNSIKECVEFSNEYAPEHLILAIKDYNDITDKIESAGSVFLGNYSCESAGDYASGTNHTLPTNGFARNYSGVSVDSFVKKISFQELTKEGIQNIGPSIELMAEAEHLIAHRNAVTVRLKNLN